MGYGTDHATEYCIRRDVSRAPPLSTCSTFTVYRLVVEKIAALLTGSNNFD